MAYRLSHPRLGVRRPAIAWRDAVTVAGVGLRHRHSWSPDRTHNEKIGDRQNTFRWGDGHAYRPHQHFTYDPTNWNHTLDEGLKPRLAIRDRLRMLEERVMEAQRSRTASQASEDGAPLEPLLPSGTASVDEGAAAAASLFELMAPTAPESPAPAPPAKPDAMTVQELIDSLEMLHERVFSPRFRSNRVKTLSDRYLLRYRDTLRAAVGKLVAAESGTTCTLDAAVCLWFYMLVGAEPLIEALVGADGRCDRTAPQRSFGTAEEAIVFLHRLLDATVIQRYVRELKLGGAGDESDPPELSCEMLVELLSVATHPLTRRASHLRLDAAADDADFSARLAVVVRDARQRAYEALFTRTAEAPPTRDAPGSDPAGILHAHHLAHYTAFLRRLDRAAGRVERLPASSAAGESTAREWALVAVVARSELRHFVTVAKSAVGKAAGRAPMRHALLGDRAAAVVPRALRGGAAATAPAAAAAASDARPSATPRRPQPSRFDADVDGPGGIRQPLLTEGDVRSAVELCDALLHAFLVDRTRVARVGLARGHERLPGDVLHATLTVLAYSPNYDLHVPTVARAMGTILRCVQQQQQPPHGVVLRSTVPQVELRCALVLSRLRLDGSDADGCRLALLADLCLHRFHAESVDRGGAELLSPLQREKEWRRLRGLCMHRLLHTVVVEEAAALRHRVAVEGADGTRWWTFEELLALGAYDGPVPLPLWEALCTRRLAGDADGPTEGQWLSLLQLRRRCRQVGGSGSRQRGTDAGEADGRGRAAAEPYYSPVPFDAVTVRLVAAVVARVAPAAPDGGEAPEGSRRTRPPQVPDHSASWAAMEEALARRMQQLGAPPAQQQDVLAIVAEARQVVTARHAGPGSAKVLRFSAPAGAC